VKQMYFKWRFFATVLPSGRKFVRWLVHSEINISTARPDKRFKRRHCSSFPSSGSLSYLTRIFRRTSSQMDERRRTPRRRRDWVLQVRWEIDTRSCWDWFPCRKTAAGGRDPLRIRGPPATFYDCRKFPFILDENKSEKEDRFPWEM